MTHQISKIHLFTKASPLMSGCLKVALVAAPFILAAPSEAITVKSVVTGFTGEFAPANWARTPIVAGSRSEFINDNSVLRLRKSAGVTPTAQATRVLDSTLFTNLRSLSPGNGALVSYSYSYDWDWSFTVPAGTSQANSATNANFNFQEIPSSTKFNTSAPLTNSFASGTLTDYSVLGASLANVGAKQGTGTALISNFQFIAEYEVPGPLPILGAGAAFGFSRKLRRRLKVSNELA